MMEAQDQGCDDRPLGGVSHSFSRAGAIAQHPEPAQNASVQIGHDCGTSRRPAGQAEGALKPEANIA